MSHYQLGENCGSNQSCRGDRKAHIYRDYTDDDDADSNVLATERVCVFNERLELNRHSTKASKSWTQKKQGMQSCFNRTRAQRRAVRVAREMGELLISKKD